MTDRLYTSTELASEFGITPRALRFYEVKSLLCPRRLGKRRVYTHRDRARLQLILRAKRLGFSLAEVKDYLDLYDADPGQAAQVRHLANLVEQRIDRLEQQRLALEATLDELNQIKQQIQLSLRRPAAVQNLNGR